MHDDEVAPLVRSQFLEDTHHLAVIGLEASNGIFTRQAAKGLGMLVE